jgi:low affinity Fe/Cu permease
MRALAFAGGATVSGKNWFSPFMVQPKTHPREHPIPPVPENERKGFSFSKFSADIATWAGSSKAFLLACIGIIGWGVSGPFYHYSDTWQLVINTTTTIITFLMVFLIQNTQNRDTRAINLKLDEIIRSNKHAHNELIDIEKLSDKDLQELAEHYERIRAECDQREAARAVLQKAQNEQEAA